MKKAAIRVLFFAVFALLLACPVRAKTETDEEARARDLFEAFRAEIPAEIADLLPDGFFSSDMGEVAEGVRQGGGLSAVLTVIERCAGPALHDNLALLARIAGVLVLSAVFRLLTAHRTGAASGRAVSLCGVLVLSLLLLSPLRAQLAGLTAYFHTIQVLFEALLPMMGVLYAMGGNIGAAVANHTVLSAFLAILGTLAAGTVAPVAGLCLALALPDALGSGISLRPLAGAIKRAFTWGLALLMLLLCGVLGIQSTLARSADSLALRAARFTAGSFLPVVGSSVGEALRTVAAGVTYLRGVTGTGGVLVIFLGFLPPFLSVLFTRFALLLGGAAAKLLACEAEGKLLAELASVFGYFLAVIASLFVTAVFALTLFAHCAAAGG